MMISKSDHARIAEAVKAAEAGSSGEIFCIVTAEVSQYREIPLAWASATALILPPLLVAFGLQPWALVSRFLPVSAERAWATGSGPSVAQTVAENLGAYAVAQAIIFAVVALIVSLPPVRRALTPQSLKRHRVKRMAQGHFISTGLINDPDRTGVLIFASLKDRQVEIVADKAIHDAVGGKVWDSSVSALVAGMKRRQPGQGFVEAINICGAALAEHFPTSGPHDNRFSDELIEV